MFQARKTGLILGLLGFFLLLTALRPDAGWARVRLPYKPLVGCVQEGLLVAKVKGYDFKQKKWVEKLCRARVQYEFKGRVHPVDLTPYEGQQVQVLGHARLSECLITIDRAHGLKPLGPCQPEQ